MAKKNLSALMDGLMGNNTERQPETAASVETTAPAVSANEKHNAETDNSEKSGAVTAEATRRGPGRPKKEAKKGAEEVRATFIVDNELLRKAKYITIIEDNLLKDVINASLGAYIEAWEAKNGKIRLPKSKK